MWFSGSFVINLLMNAIFDIGFGQDGTTEVGKVVLHQPTPSESATLDIYAFSKADIARANDAINKLWDGQKDDQTIGGTNEPKLRDIIRKLSESEVNLELISLSRLCSNFYRGHFLLKFDLDS